MDLDQISALLRGESQKDYEIYLRTKDLLKCQKEPSDLVNEDELQFQIVHQVEELWMKLIASSLIDLHKYILQKHTFKALSLFTRVHLIQKLMIDQLALLETMSPRDYQAIRLQLGNGSGQESPGFRALHLLHEPLYKAFKLSYLEPQGLDFHQIYNTGYMHDENYMLAEAFAEYDELLQKFRYHHIQLIRRSIGFDAKSLKGRSVQMLEEGARKQLFPEIWEVRNHMTDAWGGTYGVKRDSLSAETA
jgi:tryptophan 2,3-dioxygenase